MLFVINYWNLSEINAFLNENCQNAVRNAVSNFRVISALKETLDTMIIYLHDIYCIHTHQAHPPIGTQTLMSI